MKSIEPRAYGRPCDTANTCLGTGLTTAVLTGPLLRSLLFHVNPANPTVLVAAVTTVGIAAVCACLGPAYRATRTDPLPALHAD